MFVINYGHCYLLLFIVIYCYLYIVIYCYLLLFIVIYCYFLLFLVIVIYCYLLFMIQQIKDGESSDEPRSYQFFVVTNAWSFGDVVGALRNTDEDFTKQNGGCNW